MEGIRRIVEERKTTKVELSFDYLKLIGRPQDRFPDISQGQKKARILSGQPPVPTKLFVFESGTLLELKTADFNNNKIVPAKKQVEAS